MSKLKSNLAELRKIINEEIKKPEIAIEFLDAIESETDEMEETISSNTNEIKELESRVDDLETEIETNEKEEGDEINTGLGTIRIINENGNLKLQDRIDFLSATIKAEFP